MNQSSSTSKSKKNKRNKSPAAVLTQIPLQEPVSEQEVTELDQEFQIQDDKPELVDEVPSRLRAKNWDNVALLNKPTKLNQILKFLMVEDFLDYESIDIETLTENLLIHQRNLNETNGFNPFSNS